MGVSSHNIALFACFMALGARIIAAESGGGAEAMARGRQLLRERRCDEAIVFFENMLRGEPGNGAVRTNLAFAHHLKAQECAAASNLAAAVEHGRAARRLDYSDGILRTNLAVYCNNLAMSLDRDKRTDDAEALLREALRFAPDNRGIASNTAVLLGVKAGRAMRDGRNADAVKLLHEAASLDRRNAAVFENLGNAYFNLDDNAAAAANWNTALALSPGSSSLAARITAAARDARARPDFATRSRSHFTVKYDGEKREDLSWKAVDILENAYREIGDTLDCRPDGSVTVIIYSREQFRTATAAHRLVAGLYDGKVRASVDDLAGNEDKVESLLRHEYAHAVLFSKFGPGLPRWLNEGIAEMVSASSPGAPTDRILDDPAPPWTTDAHFASTNPPVLFMAYDRASSFAGYMFERYGRKTSMSFAGELTAGKTIAEVCRSLLNLTPEELFLNWKEALRRSRRD